MISRVRARVAGWTRLHGALDRTRGTVSMLVSRVRARVAGWTRLHGAMDMTRRKVSMMVSRVRARVAQGSLFHVQVRIPQSRCHFTSPCGR